MISVEELTAKSKYSTEFLLIHFTISNTYEDIKNYQFNILRSLNEFSDFETVAVDVENFEFRDYSVNLSNPSLTYYYKVRVIDKTTGEYEDSKVTYSNYVQHDQYTRYLVHVHNMYLETVINGDKMRVLKLKRFGQYCDCYDDVREKSRKPNCTDCYGTKFLGGYYDSGDIYVNFGADPQRTERFEYSGVTQDESPISLWTTTYPLLQGGDILVGPDGTRYSIIAWTGASSGAFILRQELQIQRIPATDIVYKYKISEVNVNGKNDV